MILLTVSSNIQYSELFFRSINALTCSKCLEKILGALHPANIYLLTLETLIKTLDRNRKQC